MKTLCIQFPYAAITFNKLDFFLVPFTWKNVGKCRAYLLNTT